MFEHFIKGFSNFASLLPSGVYAIIFNALIVAAFTVNIFLKNRGTFFSTCITILSLQAVFLLASGSTVYSAVFMTALSTAFCGALSLLLRIPRAKKKQPPEEIPVSEFIKSLDTKLHAPVRTSQPPAPVSAPPLRTDRVEPLLGVRNNIRENCRNKKNINITHARNIIERLSCFSLSAQDRLRVDELDRALCELETGEEPYSLLGVNEKLSALIKILAKYGA